MDIENIAVPSTSKLANKLDEIKRHIEMIEEMRKSSDAPVDTMGSHMLADKNANAKTYRFQVLVALMLSSQTKDQITAAAMNKLKLYGCNIDRIIESSEENLQEILYPVGFYKRKAEYLKKTAQIIKEKYNGDIPDSIEELCTLPGVGMKMANLALQIAFNKIEGIGVDTHVHRISNRLKWVSTKVPNETEVKLSELLPREQWSHLNKLLVGFGQQICLPVKPRCNECLIGSNNLCPWFKGQR